MSLPLARASVSEKPKTTPENRLSLTVNFTVKLPSFAVLSAASPVARASAVALASTDDFAREGAGVAAAALEPPDDPDDPESDLARIVTLIASASAAAVAVTTPLFVSPSWPPPRSIPAAVAFAVDVVLTVTSPPTARPAAMAVLVDAVS